MHAQSLFSLTSHHITLQYIALPCLTTLWVRTYVLAEHSARAISPLPFRFPKIEILVPLSPANTLSPSQVIPRSSPLLLLRRRSSEYVCTYIEIYTVQYSDPRCDWSLREVLSYMLGMDLEKYL